MILLWLIQLFRRCKPAKSVYKRRLENVHYLYASNAVWRGTRKPF